MTNLDKAHKQLGGIGIPTKIENGTLYVFIEDVELELSPFEVEFRAKKYDEENEENEENE